MKKLLFAAALAAFCSGTTLAQDADPAINILVTDNPMVQNTSNILRINASNLNQDNIVANSLEIVINIGNSGNIQFVGLAPGSDPNWVMSSSTPGTYTLRNTNGTLAAFETQNILLNILGFTVSSNNSILGTIGYIPGPNTNLPGNVASSTQGNGSDLTNDNSTTTLTINPATGLSSRLLSFEGTAQKCDAVLSWKRSEPSADQYELERSTDGRQFAVADAVAIRLAADPGMYTATVAQPSAQAYYRLKITSPDGKASWSSILHIQTQCDVRTVSIFPNPVTTQATVTGIAAGDQIRLYNSAGQQVRSVTSTGTQAQLHLQGLAAGTYQVLIKGASQQITLPVLKLE
ncbi:MAG: T9SS type A sorting domain-containing protein [Sphingobacteriales bacterium]|nr:MAG: T9SS type A sorting domain-containing protein [Sphingobacteriales bacterium]